MIDTIKLIVPFDERPSWVSFFRKLSTLDLATGVSRTNINPTHSYKNAGIYLPRMTYNERPSQDGRTFRLAIELSLPKLLYGNNFSEVSEPNFDVICRTLSALLQDVYSLNLTPLEIQKATVGRVDYCKNIVFNDYTPVLSIVNSMRTADISKTYDVQKTDFKNGGHIWHIHTNSLDVAMYDKVADLKQERVSPKRSHEADGYGQMYLLKVMDTNRPLSVARFEVRLNGVSKIKLELANVGSSATPTFSDLYKASVARKILLRHWQYVFNKIPKALLDNETPEQLLLNLVTNAPGIKAREALALVGMKLLSNGKDERELRNLIEELFTPSQYRRLKIKTREPPGSNQLQTLLKVTEAIQNMEPVSFDDYC